MSSFTYPSRYSVMYSMSWCISSGCSYRAVRVFSKPMRKWHCSNMPVPIKPATSCCSPAEARALRRHSSHPSVQLAARSGACTVSRHRVMSGHTVSSSLCTGIAPGASSGKLMVVPHRSFVTEPRLRLPRR